MKLLSLNATLLLLFTSAVAFADTGYMMDLSQPNSDHGHSITVTGIFDVGNGEVLVEFIDPDCPHKDSAILVDAGSKEVVDTSIEGCADFDGWIATLLRMDVKDARNTSLE